MGLVNDEKPYIETTRVVVDRAYNPNYGDHRICKCGHIYGRHFDPYEGNAPVGCKYCQCDTFDEKIENGRWYIVTGRIEYDDEDSSEIIEASSDIDAVKIFKDRMSVHLQDGDTRDIYCNLTFDCGTEKPKLL